MAITLSKTIELHVTLKGELISLTDTRRDKSRHRHTRLKALWDCLNRREAAHSAPCEGSERPGVVLVAQQVKTHDIYSPGIRPIQFNQFLN